MSAPSTSIRQAPYVAPVSFQGLAFLSGPHYSFVGENTGDAIGVSDALASAPGVAIGDAVTLSESLAELRTVLTQDGVGIAEAVAAVLAAASSVSDSASAADALRAGYVQVLSDSAAASDVAGLASGIAARIVDLVAAQGVYAPSAAASSSISDTVALSDAGVAGLVAVIADAITAAATALGVTVQSVTITDTAILADGLDLALIQQALIADTVVTSESLPSFLQAVQSLRDSILFTAEVVTPEGDRYVGWVYSPASQAASEIAGYDFFEFATHALGTIAARSDGLYLLTGTTDNGDPIPWYLRTGKMPLGDGFQSRPESVYVSGTSEGDITLRVTASGGRGGEQEYDYHLDRVSNGIAENFRTKVGKGLRGAYVQFALFGEDDSDISGLMVRFIKTSRRI